MRYAPNVADDSVTKAVDPESRGIVLSLLAVGADASALERLDEKRRLVCIEAWRKLQCEAERGRILAAWRTEAASAVPRGLDRLHPSWIVAALAGEPAPIVRMVLAELPEPLRAQVRSSLAGEDPRLADGSDACSLAVKREVLQVAFGWLAPLCESDGGPVAESLCALAFDDLLTDVLGRGARAVGQSLVGAAPALRARAMAAAGEPWAQVIGKASAENVSDADRKTAMAHANTPMPDAARTPSDRLLHIGLAALKSELVAEHAGSIFRVAGRLPASLGRPLINW